MQLFKMKFGVALSGFFFPVCICVSGCDSHHLYQRVVTEGGSDLAKTASVTTQHKRQ